MEIVAVAIVGITLHAFLRSRKNRAPWVRTDQRIRVRWWHRISAVWVRWQWKRDRRMARRLALYKQYTGS